VTKTRVDEERVLQKKNKRTQYEESTTTNWEKAKRKE